MGDYTFLENVCYTPLRSKETDSKRYLPSHWTTIYTKYTGDPSSWNWIVLIHPITNHRKFLKTQPEETINCEINHHTLCYSDSKDPGIDIDETSTRQFRVESMSNRYRPEDLCYLGMFQSYLSLVFVFNMYPPTPIGSRNAGWWGHKTRRHLLCVLGWHAQQAIAYPRGMYTDWQFGTNQVHKGWTENDSPPLLLADINWR